MTCLKANRKIVFKIARTFRLDQMTGKKTLGLSLSFLKYSFCLIGVHNFQESKKLMGGTFNGKYLLNNKIMSGTSMLKNAQWDIDN